MKGKNDSKYGLSMNLHLIHFFRDKQPQRPLGHLSTFIISVVGNTQFLPSTGTRELENEQRMSLTCIPALLPICGQYLSAPYTYTKPACPHHCRSSTYQALPGSWGSPTLSLKLTREALNTDLSTKKSPSQMFPENPASKQKWSLHKNKHINIYGKYLTTKKIQAIQYSQLVCRKTVLITFLPENTTQQEKGMN